MNKTQYVLAAIAVAGAALAPLTHAADVSLAEQAISLTDGTGVFAHMIAAGNQGNTFSDRFDFSAAAGTLGSVVSAISPPPVDGIQITGFSLYNSGGLSLSGTKLLDGATDVWTLSTAHLVPDNYYLLVSGTLLSPAAASYSGSITVAAVPEPETYAMLLGGLGVLGFLARRRSKRPGA